MQKGDYLTTLLRSPKTVFTLKDIALVWQEADTNAARVRLNYYVRHGDLYHIRRGVYAKGKEYNKLELATRIFTPSYISFETVLLREGVIFQYTTDITCASYVARDITIEDQVYSYRKVKNTVLVDGAGIREEHEVSIATKERAFLDTLYSKGEYHFDNLRSIDWEKVYAMLPIYDNKRMKKRVDALHL